MVGASVDATKSQQFSHYGELGSKDTLRPNETAQPAISSIRDRRASSNASRHGINNSHIPFLPASDDSHLNDENILQDRETGDYHIQSNDELTADAFQARNSTNVKRKPPRNPSSQSQQKEDQDENFIDQVTEPMKAKTKTELLGPGVVSSDRSPNSHRSSKQQSSK